MRFQISVRAPSIRVFATLLFVLTVRGFAAADEPVKFSPTTGRPPPLEDKDYEQWAEAKTTLIATAASVVRVVEGFEVELLRSAAPGEGSWVSLAFDPKGRVIIAREGTSDHKLRGLLRVTLGESPRIESIDETLQECRGLLWAFDALYAQCNVSTPDRPSGLYRLRDTDGDDTLDEVKLLRHAKGGGHGLNDLALGPDGMLYLIQGDQSFLPDDWSPEGSPIRHWGLDQVTDGSGKEHAREEMKRPPMGRLIRTDREGRAWHVVACGLRNPYGIDFNRDGECFTYEADMELDIGLPWYRPTHIVHLVSGADYGWRSGSDPWRFYYPDRPPPGLVVGLGSPTAVKFGTHSNFPLKYRDALFAVDWAYGRVLAVTLTPRGAGYDYKSEHFLHGRPLNITDLDFGPDGAMYFTTGGRGTQSGLYRVRYTGPVVEESPRVEDLEAAKARALRRHLESFHGSDQPGAISAAWPHLGSADLFIRHAARIAFETQPADKWVLLALDGTTSPREALTALIAWARVGTDAHRRGMLRRPWFPAAADDEQRSMVLRAYGLAIHRGGRPDESIMARLAQDLSLWYPARSRELNRELARFLAYLGAPDLPARTLPLIEKAATQEEMTDLLNSLRHVKSGWTDELRVAYFRLLGRARAMPGGRAYPAFMESLIRDAMAGLTPDQRGAAESVLASTEHKETPDAFVARPFVKDWTLAELEKDLDEVARDRDLNNGKAMFHAVCAQCHRFGETGTLIGPDLTAITSRLGRRDILLSVLDPSAVIDEKYRLTVVTKSDGTVLAGSITAEDERSLTLFVGPRTPEQVLATSDVKRRIQSPISPMPAGLLNTLTRDDVLDLLAYLERGAEEEREDLSERHKGAKD